MNNFFRLLSFAIDCSLNTHNLLNSRPIQELRDREMSLQSATDQKTPDFDATVVLLKLANLFVARLLMFKQQGHVSQKLGLVGLDGYQVVAPPFTICSQMSRWQ